MSLEIIIILGVLIFLAGSFSYAIPSKKSQEISKFRMEALKFGAKINILTKADTTFKSNDLSLVNYVIKNNSSLQDAHFIRDKTEFILYSPLKLKYEDNFFELISKLNNLSEDVVEIVYKGKQITFLWKEQTDLTKLKQILEELNRI